MKSEEGAWQMSFEGSSWDSLSLAGVRRIFPFLAGSSRQRGGKVFSSKLWGTKSPSLALSLNPLARLGQVPLPPALSNTQDSSTV